MLYIEHDQPHILLWPVVAFGWSPYYGWWVGIAWLNKEIGWKERTNV